MTKPIDELLPLPLDENIQHYMNFYHDTLHELVCFGTHILKWSLDQYKERANTRDETDMAPALLFRHILEMVDAISIQLKAGVVVPCKVHLRVILEALLSLEYMLDDHRSRRATCFLLVDHYRKLDFYKKLAPGTPENVEFMKDVIPHSTFMSNFTPKPSATKMVKNLEELIALPIYKEAREEYLKILKKRPKAEIKWYSLFDGPVSVPWLAARLKRKELYEFFYKSWSNTTHSTSLADKVLVKGDDGFGAIVQLRCMEEAHAVVTQTIMFVLHVYVNSMSKKVIPIKRDEILEWNIDFKKRYRDPLLERKINFL